MLEVAAREPCDARAVRKGCPFCRDTPRANGCDRLITQLLTRLGGSNQADSRVILEAGPPQKRLPDQRLNPSLCLVGQRRNSREALHRRLVKKRSTNGPLHEVATSSTSFRHTFVYAIDSEEVGVETTPLNASMFSRWSSVEPSTDLSTDIELREVAGEHVEKKAVASAGQHSWESAFWRPAITTQLRSRVSSRPTSALARTEWN